MRTLHRAMRVVLLAAAVSGCNNASTVINDMTTTMDIGQKPDLASSGGDMAGGGGDMGPTCINNPTTHAEIINACTSAQFFDKMPRYPTLAPNGQLPPLQ